MIPPTPSSPFSRRSKIDAAPPIPWKIEHHARLDSTNQHALTRIQQLWQSNQSPHALVITAATQSAGKGQHGRSWLSPEGGLYLSAIVENIPTHLRDKLPLLAGVATVNALQPFTSQKILLRWPNDIVLNHQKLAGILCESIAQAPHFASVIGIGINLTTHLASLPQNLQPHATTLQAHAPTPISIPTIQSHLLASLATAIHQLTTQGFPPLLTQARQLDALKDQHLQLLEGITPLDGIARGLSDEGHLLLQTPTTTLTLPQATLLSINQNPLR